MRPEHAFKSEQESAEPRLTRSSGVISIVPALRAECSRGARVERPNARLADVESMLVDAAYLEEANRFRESAESAARFRERLSDVARERERGARRRRLGAVVAATCAFVSSALITRLAIEHLPSGLERARAAEARSEVVRAAAVAPASVEPAPISLPVVSVFAAPAPALAPDPAEDVRRARLLHKEGRTTEARELLLAVLDERPGHPGALLTMAGLELSLGAPDEAVSWARRGVQALPWSARHWDILATALAQAGDPGERARARARAAQLRKSHLRR